MKKLSSVVMIVCLVAFYGVAHANTVIDLPAGFNQGKSWAINDYDQIAGTMWYNPTPSTSVIHPTTPFIWYGYSTGPAVALAGYNPQRDYMVQDLSNAANVVVGYYFDSRTPWLWDTVNHFNNTLTFEGFSTAQAIRIDEAQGLVFGRAQKTLGGIAIDDLVTWSWDGSQWVFEDTGLDGTGLPYQRNNINPFSGNHSGSETSLALGTIPVIKDTYRAPEPDGMVLLGAGLLVLGLWMYRRRASLARAPRA